MAGSRFPCVGEDPLAALVNADRGQFPVSPQVVSFSGGILWN